MMKKINIPLSDTKHCLLACINSILKLYGYEFDEAELFLIGGGYYMEYIAEEDFLGTSYNKLVFNCNNSELFSAKLIIDNLPDDRFAWLNFIDLQISAGSPVILCMNSSYLYYHKEFNNERKHFIVINGVDKSTSIVHVTDFFMQDNKGRSSQFEGDIDINRICDGIWGCILIKPNSYACKKLDKNVALYLLLTSLKKYTCDSNFESGDALIRLYLKEIYKYEKMGEKEFLMHISNMYYYLKHSSVFHILYYTKQIIQKHLNNQEELVQEIENQIFRWKAYCMNLMKLCVKNENDKVLCLYEKGSEHLNDIKNILNKVVNYIEKERKIL